MNVMRAEDNRRVASSSLPPVALTMGIRFACLHRIHKQLSAGSGASRVRLAGVAGNFEHAAISLLKLL